MSTGTVFYDAGTVTKTAIGAIKAFTTSRMIHAISNPEELRLITRHPNGTQGKFYPVRMGGVAEAPVHILA